MYLTSLLTGSLMTFRAIKNHKNSINGAQNNEKCRFYEGKCPYEVKIRLPAPHKEDNGHVEQKNGDKVRKLVGYHRYDSEKQVELLNGLYDIEDLISNFFLPSQKLIEKVKDGKGRVVRRRYDQARTAYQRLLETKDVDQKVKVKVKKMYNQLNLVELRNQSEKLQQQLFRTVI